MTLEYSMSEKVKDYLHRKLNDCTMELIKLKRKRRIIKILYVSTVISSIVFSSIVVSLTSIISVPIILMKRPLRRRHAPLMAVALSS